MKKIILIFSVFLFSVLLANAQELKKDCNPSSCGPNDTKVEEAAIVTNLRNSIVDKKTALKEKHLVGSLKIAIGENEEQSLAILVTELNQLEALLGKNKTDFADLSGAKLVQKLNVVLKNLD